MSILDKTTAEAATTSGPETLAPTQVAPASAPAGVGRRSAVLGFAERYALVGLLALIVLFFSLYPDSAETFPTRANLNVLLGNQAVTALLALAVLMPLICGHFDFSVGAVAASSSVACAGLMSRHSVSLLLCVLAAVLFGALVGAVNGLLVTRFAMSAFVSTLGMATLLGGVIQWYTKGQAISSNISDSLVSFGSLSWWGVPRLVYVVAVALVVLWYLLSQTPYGRSLYAIGSNPRAAALVGIPVRGYSFLGFVGAGTLAGVAGVLLAARTGGATADSGTAMLFPALAAVFLGATAIQPGRFNVWGTLVGVLFVSVSVSGLTLAGASDWVNPVFNGLALLLAVALSSLLASRRAAGRT
ncbi:MAG TPA: ABC transporter permease [Mycobacteriales bacterium]|nr:ABC transporter permease [Mycobacteriales bacterium]